MESRDGVLASGAGSRRERQQQEPRQRDGEIFFIAYGRSVGLLTTSVMDCSIVSSTMFQAVCME